MLNFLDILHVQFQQSFNGIKWQDIYKFQGKYCPCLGLVASKNIRETAFYKVLVPYLYWVKMENQGDLK